MLHVAQISFFLDPQRRESEELLREWWSLTEIAEAAAHGGVKVSVIQACVHSRLIQRGGVDYYFLDSTERALSRTAEFASLLHRLRPDVLHVHGLGFADDVLALTKLTPATPILLQDHADRVPRFWRRGAWRRGATCASGFSFCARSQSDPFRVAELLPAHAQIFEIPESTTRFASGDQRTARARTGMYGSPCALWVGHLDKNKDPLTVLRGVELAIDKLPDLQLWCCFASAPLIDEVTSYLDARPELSDRVHLLGRRPHEEVEQLMRAADLFVLGSHREGSGYSLIEALACGVVPVVTDIPSFRALTGNGSIGFLWPCGNSNRLAEQLALAAEQRPSRIQVQSHFDAELSMKALGEKWSAAYRTLQVRSAEQAA